MPELLAAIDAFLQEHSRCGELDSDVEEGKGLDDVRSRGRHRAFDPAT
jgi:hypothetical protein